MTALPVHTSLATLRFQRPMRRALAKQRTREKILASAKMLFAQRGFSGATIRDIAAAAGLSTGAVFASFADKVELFGEVIAADRRALAEAMSVAAAGETVEAQLLAMFEAGYRLGLQNLPLLQATVSVSWSPQLGAQVRDRLRECPIADIVGGVLVCAVEKGELSPAMSVPLISQILQDCFESSFRHAAFDGWRLNDLKARLAEQVRILLAAQVLASPARPRSP
jgi:AcrR family transcriptional regulator